MKEFFTYHPDQTTQLSLSVSRAAAETEAQEAAMERLSLDHFVHGTRIFMDCFVETGVRAPDRVNFLYFNAKGWTLAEITAYARAFQRGEVTAESLARLVPPDTSLAATKPTYTRPRLDLWSVV